MLDLKTFIVAVKFASHASATKDARYYLNGLLFELRPNMLTLVGTDGHRMAIIELSGEFGDVHADIICKTADIKLLLATYRANKGEVTVGVENGQLKLESYGMHTLMLTGIEGKFPDWRRVMPQGDAVATTMIGVNAIYIADAAKAAALLGNKYVGLKMEMRGSSNSMWLEPVVAEYYPAIKKCGAVVMPMRL